MVNELYLERKKLVGFHEMFDYYYTIYYILLMSPEYTRTGKIRGQEY